CPRRSRLLAGPWTWLERLVAERLPSLCMIIGNRSFNAELHFPAGKISEMQAFSSQGASRKAYNSKR
ncbi:MAG: hypothetical protein KDB07_10750, partial [Planctomycetes bacterium]|nr:hypothetical protein [Planctomycetota bacterium]